MVKITVFTPTYNRGYILSKLYDSLCKQSYNDFEWLVVDDGSGDNTEELVSEWINRRQIPIRYYKKENGGKHSAINMGVKLAQGQYFIIVDSDDYLCDDALLQISNYFEKEDVNINIYAGIAGTKITTDGKLIGTMFQNKDYVDCTSLERNENKIRGDKAEVFFVELLKRYPFPEFEGERFINEAVVWNRIARDGYKIRWFNIPFIVCEYRDDGLTSQKGKLQKKNPKGTLLYLKELIISDKKLIKKIAHRASYIGIAKGIYSERYICEQLNISRVMLPIYKLIYKVRGTN